MNPASTGILWRDSPVALAGLLRQHGETPERVTSTETAWTAFSAFLALPVDGLEPDPDGDTDGFIVQWGRHSWNDRLPSLSFTRQFAVDVRATWTEPDRYQPECWQVALDLVYPDAPALADLGRLAVQDTGFDFSAIGAGRDLALGSAKRALQEYPALRALWAGTPARSAITLDRAG